MTASCVVAAAQLRIREPNVQPHDFMPDALPVSTLAIYADIGLAHSMLNCRACLQQVVTKISCDAIVYLQV